MINESRSTTVVLEPRSTVRCSTPSSRPSTTPLFALTSRRAPRSDPQHFARRGALAERQAQRAETLLERGDRVVTDARDLSFAEVQHGERLQHVVQLCAGKTHRHVLTICERCPDARSTRRPFYREPPAGPPGPAGGPLSACRGTVLAEAGGPCSADCAPTTRGQARRQTKTNLRIEHPP